MNDLSDLSDLRSLASEADTLTDDLALARPAAVHARVRGVRRRRLAVGGGAVALVLLASGVGVAGLHRRPDTPRPATGTVDVIGVDVPRSVDVTGFPYVYAGQRDVTVSDGGSTQIQLPGDETTTFSLVATGLGDGKATLLFQDYPVARVLGGTGDAVADPVHLRLPPHAPTVTLTGAPEGARVAVVSYEADGLPADGVTDGTVVFRDQVAGRRLLRGTFNDPGSNEIRLRSSGNRIDASTTCDAGGDVRVSLSADGKDLGDISCGNADRDAGTSWTGMDDLSDGKHVVTAGLTTSDGTPVPAGDVRFGLALYTAAPSTQVLGTAVPDVVEQDGRTWKIDRVVDDQSAPGTPLTDRLEPAATDVLVACVVRSSVRYSTVTVTVNGDPDCGVKGSLTPHFSTGHAIFAGDPADVVLDSIDPGFTGALVYYRPVD